MTYFPFLFLYQISTAIFLLFTGGTHREIAENSISEVEETLDGLYYMNFENEGTMYHSKDTLLKVPH